MAAHQWRGAIVGYVASRTMDAVTAMLYERQGEGSRRREEEVAPGGMPRETVRQIGRLLGRSLDDETAGRVAHGMHRGLGIVYGAVAASLVHRGWRPMAAGPTVGLGAFAVVDEGLAIDRAPQFPLVTHLRGLAGHATWGVVAGILLALTEPGRADEED